MSVTDSEYDGEIVTLGIRIFEGVADEVLAVMRSGFGVGLQ
jgi:hypothetical protein